MAKILVYGDSPCSNTGLGIVARNVIDALLGAGHDITAFSINHWFAYVDHRRFPYPIYAAGMNREGDVFGSAEFVRTAQRLRPDLILALTDIQVIRRFMVGLREVFDGPVVVHVPVDVDLLPVDIQGLENVTRVTTYTYYGQKELVKYGV